MLVTSEGRLVPFLDGELRTDVELRRSHLCDARSSATDEGVCGRRPPFREAHPVAERKKRPRHFEPAVRVDEQLTDSATGGSRGPTDHETGCAVRHGRDRRCSTKIGAEAGPYTRDRATREAG